LLKNPEFEEGFSGKIPKYWGTEYYNCSLGEGVSGKAIKVTNKTPLMSLGAQEIKIDPKKVTALSLSAWIKIEDVVSGPEDWNKANMQLLFFNSKGDQVGGWPELGKWSGNFDWKKVAKNFMVPKDAASAKVVFGLYNCTGTIYIDNIVLSPVEDTKSTDPYNLLENGGFEIWEKWAYGGSTDWGIVFDDVKEGNGAIRINNVVPIWSFASQSVPLDGSKVKKIKLSGYIKSNNVVPGVKAWQLARVNIEFKDSKGKRIDGWPILEAFSGSFPWKYVEKTFDVPSDTSRVDVFAGLLECSGEVWFDGLKLEAFDSKGGKIRSGGYFVTDTKNWHQFKAKSLPKSKAISDVSFLLDPPAGKHGFLKVKDGHFYFENGKRAKFWGTNIYAPSTFPSKKDAEIMADRLAKAGCNLVRIHHLDAFWSNPNIFDQDYKDTQHLSADSLDKLDYLLYQLKKRGIYVFMDLMVDREFKEDDGVLDYKNVERGAKITGLYNERLIELQKLYAKQLLTHYNPYTKMRYVDDPSIVSAKIINESMMFYIGTQFGLSKQYLAELDKKWNEWLSDKYKNRGNLEKAWTDKYGRMDLSSDEDFKKGNVARADIPLRYQRGGGEKREPYRLADTLKFYEELQVKYFVDMENYLKSLGLKVPVSGSNHWVNVYADVKSNAVLDYIDRHRYWDHPQFGYGTKIVFENQSMLKNPKDALPNNFAFYRVKDKPFVISEWNASFPNEYRVEGPILMAAYANLQDWDGVLQFSFNNAGWQAPMEDNFDISAWPNVFSQWPAAAIMFYRGDVLEAKSFVDARISDEEMYGPINEDNPIAESPLLPLITKTMINFDANTTGNPYEYQKKYHDENKKEILSDTKELKWNYGKGIFTVDTDKSQAVIGFLRGNKIVLKDVSVSSQNVFCSISLSSISGAPISKSSKILVTAAARVENKGQRYNESKTQLETVGTAPLLVEGVGASLNFKRKIKSVKALDINGEFVKNIKPNGKAFTISAGDKAFFYEVSF